MEFTLNQDLYNNPLPDFLEVQAQVLQHSQHSFDKDKTRTLRWERGAMSSAGQ